VVIDTYNYGRFIEDAIESALAQNFPREQMEILVVDDGSTDDTAERVRKYSDSVQYFRKSNGGQASSINFGTAHARGEFVAFLDADDVWMPEKLSRVMEEFAKDLSVVMVYHRYCFWSSNGNRTWERGFSQASGDILGDRRKVLEYGAAPTSSLVFRRSALQKLVPVPEDCSFMHDAYLIATVLFLGPVGVVSDCLTKNRVHGQNLWFAERDDPPPEVLRRRVQAREAAITAIDRWMNANAAGVRRREGRAFLRRLRLIQDEDEFRLEPPSRIREFVHLCGGVLVLGRTVSLGSLAYRWVYAFTVLIVGAKRARFLETVRTGIKKLLPRRREPRPASERTGETAGHA
jgi:glycosyltransferase involved in cell wall biosynthesis